MPRHFDPLTYRYPRTSIEAFGCNAEETVAIHCGKKEPMNPWSVVCYAAAVVLAVASAAIVIFG